VLQDFAPISLLSTSPVVMVGANALPYRDLRELIEGARQNPGKVSFATFGQGSAPHIISGAFQAASATRFQIVPYRGTGPALQDLVAGHIDVMVSEIAGALPYWRERRIRAYALLSPTRSKAAPEIPTIEEAGGPPLHVVTWRGLWAPRGTPASIVEKLNAAVVEALGDPELQKRVADIGQEIVPRSRMNPGALAAHHRSEMEHWQALIKATGP
jgi:tripartite-type tricarboxylate transporter receptor subunit TctC